MLEKTLESALDSKEIQPVYPKGNQSWIFIGRTDAETPILWLPDAKTWLIGKDPDAGKDWRQEEKGKTGKMVGWHHLLNRHEFEQTLKVGDGQGGLAYCSPWGWKESDMTEWLNWTELNISEHWKNSALVKKSAESIGIYMEKMPLYLHLKHFLWFRRQILKVHFYIFRIKYKNLSSWLCVEQDF